MAHIHFLIFVVPFIGALLIKKYIVGENIQYNRLVFAFFANTLVLYQIIVLSTKQTMHQITSSLYNASTAIVIAVLFQLISNLFNFETQNDSCPSSKSKFQTIVYWTLGFCAVILLTFLITAFQFVYNKFGQLDTDVIMFQVGDFANQNQKDSNDLKWIIWYFKTIFVYAELASVIAYAMAIFYFPLTISLKKSLQKYIKYEIKFTINANFIHFLHLIFFINIIFTAVKVPTLRYTTFFEENYVQPNIANMEFPKQKRNLILLVLESMESTYVDKRHGGYFEDSKIPNLQKNAMNSKYLHFTHNDRVGGAYQVPGTGWSIAGMFAMECGLPIRVSYSMNYNPDPNKFLPGAYCLGEALKEKGYHGTVFYGTPAEYQHLDVVFKSHGADEIIDSNIMSGGGWSKDYETFGYAKKHIEKLAKTGQPFYALVDTFDNHFTGHLCKKCNTTGCNNTWHSVMNCVDQQAQDFIEWFEKSPFYENTTLFIQGDHLTLNGPFNNEMSYTKYLRTTYNLVVNSAIKTEHNKNRHFTMMDIYPTILASIGVKIKGEKLGMGTNLFSKKQTLVEKYGLPHVYTELSKQSDWFDTKIAQLVKENFHLAVNATWNVEPVALK